MYSWHACRCEWMQINFCLAHISSCFLAALNFSHVLVMIKSFRSALKQWKESFFPLCCLSHVYHVEHIPSFRARSLLKYILHFTSKLYKHVKLIFIYFCKRDAKFPFWCLSTDGGGDNDGLRCELQCKFKLWTVQATFRALRAAAAAAVKLNRFRV